MSPTPQRPASSTRRRLLQGSGALMASSFVGAMGALHSRRALAAGGKQTVSAASPYGPIAPALDLATGLPLLQLPAGFAYQSLGWTDDPMGDGRPTPNLHDGMAVVRSVNASRSRQAVLVRNHERGLVASTAQTIIAAANYDTTRVEGIVKLGGDVIVRIGNNNVVALPGQPDPPPFSGFCAGGTTNLLWRDGRFGGAFSSLGGTLGNCAGGPTPWGSWLSCEETVLDFAGIGGRKHGYVFEVGAEAAQTIASPIVGMGRFVHEAVAVDPDGGAVYLTEDNRNAAVLYRYLPTDTGRRIGALQQGGRLQAARIKAIVVQATPLSLVQSNNLALLNPDIGDEYQLEWVDIDNADADPRTVLGLPGGIALAAIAGCTFEALGKGCARMSRGEGIWHAGRKMFIVDTGAGLDASNRPGRGEGAVWQLDLGTQRLKALLVSGNQTAANNPDNVTVSPRGGIVLCEDGGGSTDAFGTGSRLLGLNAGGEAYIFVKNNIQLTAGQLAAAGKLVPAGDYRGFEFCGACFDVTGRVLFVNVQTPGISFAITGPWAAGNL